MHAAVGYTAATVSVASPSQLSHPFSGRVFEPGNFAIILLCHTQYGRRAFPADLRASMLLVTPSIRQRSFTARISSTIAAWHNSIPANQQTSFDS